MKCLRHKLVLVLIYIIATESTIYDMFFFVKFFNLSFSFVLCGAAIVQVPMHELLL